MKSIIQSRKVEINHHVRQFNLQLIKAIEIGDLELVKVSIEKGARVHTYDGISLHYYSSVHETVLHLAAKLGRDEILKYFLLQSCDVNAVTRDKQATPLHYACYQVNANKCIALLLDHNAEVDAMDYDAASPLMWAAYLNNHSAIQPLLEAGANPHRIDDFGLSSLDWACRQGGLASVQVLLKKIDYTNKQLNNAQHEANDNGQVDIANYLLAQYERAR